MQKRKRLTVAVTKKTWIETLLEFLMCFKLLQLLGLKTFADPLPPTFAHYLAVYVDSDSQFVNL